MPSVHNSFSMRVLKENRRVVKSDADSGSDRTAEVDNFHGSALRRARRMFPARVLLTAFRPLDISSSMRGVLMDISLGTASENLVEDFEFQLIVGKAYDVQRGPRRATHRINVAEAIGRGDLSEQKRIVDQRRKKVERLEDDQIVAQTERSGVT